MVVFSHVVSGYSWALGIITNLSIKFGTKYQQTPVCNTGILMDKTVSIIYF